MDHTDNCHHQLPDWSLNYINIADIGESSFVTGTSRNNCEHIHYSELYHNVCVLPWSTPLKDLFWPLKIEKWVNRSVSLSNCASSARTGTGRYRGGPTIGSDTGVGCHDIGWYARSFCVYDTSTGPCRHGPMPPAQAILEMEKYIRIEEGNFFARMRQHEKFD